MAEGEGNNPRAGSHPDAHRNDQTKARNTDSILVSPMIQVISHQLLLPMEAHKQEA